jgi:dTDP-4-amino-4,6-dideoxygalactose transaminase
VLVDVDPERFTLAPQALRETLLELRRRGVQPRVVIPVHIYGCMADMPAILEAAEEFGLVVVEDAAQAHGARLHGRRAGAWGHAGTFSFYPTKNLGAIGDGGAIVTRDRELGTQARTLREYGWVDRYISAFKGMNSRLDELQAAILRVKLAHLDNDNEARTRIARVYDEGLRDCPIALPRVPDGVDHVYHQYVVRSDRRDELQAYLRGREIITLVHYPEPVHRQPAYTDVFHLPLPVTEQARLEVLSLPMYPELPLEHAEQTVEAVRAFFGC